MRVEPCDDIAVHNIVHQVSGVNGIKRIKLSSNQHFLIESAGEVGGRELQVVVRFRNMRLGLIRIIPQTEEEISFFRNCKVATMTLADRHLQVRQGEVQRISLFIVSDRYLRSKGEPT